jgi:hypothetical protein
MQTLRRIESKPRNDNPNITSYGSTTPQEPEPTPAPKTPVSGPYALLKQPALQSLIASSFMLSFLSTSSESIFVLLCYTPPAFGGLGLSVSWRYKLPSICAHSRPSNHSLLRLDTHLPAPASLSLPSALASFQSYCEILILGACM